MVFSSRRSTAGEAAGLEIPSTTPAPLSATMSSVLHQLMSVLEDRKINPPPNSYTARLYAGGDAKIGSKISEEAHELVEAAGESGDQGRRHLIYETSDVLYHVLVLLAHHGIKLEEVEAEIARRFGQSGLDEKAARTVTVAK
jgi:phosphoribosyl-ATP pyrophosphohydrolase